MKVIEWIKEHKTEILIATGTVVLGGLCIYGVTKKTPKVDTSALATTFVKPEHLKLEGFDVGVCDDVLKYNDGGVELWLDNVKLEQMGQLGEEIVKRVTDLPENPNVWALLCIREDRE